MNPFREQRIRGLHGFRIVVKNPKMFLRPVDEPRGNMPTPTAGMAYPLSLGQETLTAPQFFLRTLALGDVYDDGGEKRRRASSRRDQGTAEVRPDHIVVLAPVAFLYSLLSSLRFYGLPAVAVFLRQLRVHSSVI